MPLLPPRAPAFAALAAALLLAAGPARAADADVADAPSSHAAAKAPTAEHPTPIWLDVDTANGIGESDDGLLMIASFHSPEVRVVGVSAVFGNAPAKYTYPVALNITRAFGPKNTPVAPGADGPGDFDKPTPAVQAMAKALKHQPMTILATGPVTNVAALIQQHPDLTDRIQAIVMCAARRNVSQKFLSTPQQPRPFRDANFEHDPQAMQVILDTKIPLVFAGWEVASHVWLTRDDIDALRRHALDGPAAGASPWTWTTEDGKPAAPAPRDGSGLYIYATIQQWIDAWENRLHGPGGNPFDTLSLGCVIHRDWYKGYDAKVRIVQGPRDQPGEDASATKPYLIAPRAEKADQGRKAVYLTEPNEKFKPWLLKRLGGVSLHVYSSD